MKKTESATPVTYIHYGDQHFYRDRFNDPKNVPYLNKPRGGFWASRIDAQYGWKDWNKDEEYTTCDPSNAVKFTLSNARLLKIKSQEQLLETFSLYGIKEQFEYISHDKVLLDFEQLKEDYDAIEVLISADNRLYWSLYGWDCDSILILNPDVIEEIQYD